MEVGDFTDFDGNLIPMFGSDKPKYRNKFESILINSSHAVQKLIDSVAKDLEDNPLQEGEDYYVMGAIRAALNNIYSFDTEEFFDITLTNLSSARPSVGIAVKSEDARRKLMFKMEERLEQEIAAASKRK